MAKLRYDMVDIYRKTAGSEVFYAMEGILKPSEQTDQGIPDTGAIRHKDFVLHLLNVKKEEKILDVGCEAGAMMVYAGLLGAEVYGVDICPESVEKANKYLSKYSVKGKAVVGDARKINFPDNYFDKVISSDFIEHLSAKNNIQVLKEIKRVLKPGGVIVLKTPNLTYLKFSRLLQDVKENLAIQNPFSVIIPHTTGDNHQHIGLLTKGRSIKIIRAAKFLNLKFFYSMNSRSKG